MRGPKDGLHQRRRGDFSSAKAPILPILHIRPQRCAPRNVSIKEKSMQKEYRPILATLVDQPLSGRTFVGSSPRFKYAANKRTTSKARRLQPGLRVRMRTLCRAVTALAVKFTSQVSEVRAIRRLERGDKSKNILQCVICEMILGRGYSPMGRYYPLVAQRPLECHSFHGTLRCKNRPRKMALVLTT